MRIQGEIGRFQCSTFIEEHEAARISVPASGLIPVHPAYGRVQDAVRLLHVSQAKLAAVRRELLALPGRALGRNAFNHILRGRLGEVCCHLTLSLCRFTGGIRDVLSV